MKVGLLYPPHAPVLSQRRAAPLHIAHMISILREECDVSDIEYADFNMVPFYLYYLSVHELLSNNLLKMPIPLLKEEKTSLLDRIILENVFNVPKNYKTNTFFDIDKGIIEGLKKILNKLLDSMIERVSIVEMDALILFTSISICHTLVLIDLIRKRDKDIPIVLIDNYTFEPATPYFASFVTHKDYFNNDINHILLHDPLFPIMEKKIPDLVDWIIMGEGHDAVRLLFNSNVPAKEIEGIFFSKNSVSKFHKLKLDQNMELEQTSGIHIIRSQQIDLDSLPLPDYGLMEGVYNNAEIEITRGCSYQCVFCERSGMFGSAVRSHSPHYMDRLVSHLQQYDFDFYTFIDTALNVDEKSTIRFLETLKENAFFEYQANLRGKIPNKRLIKLLKDTGCKEITTGMETGDESVLKSMKKSQNLKILEKMFKNISDYEIPLLLLLIVGFPTETPTSVDKTIDFIEHVSSFSEIDCVWGELYHVGHIQKLRPASYEDYGIKWKGGLTVQNIKRSSRIFTEPGFFGLTYFTKGMNRVQLNKSLKRYICSFTQLGIQHLICPPWSDDHESNCK